MIPPVFNRYWTGPPMPSEYASFSESWLRHHPGWTMRFWSDDLPPLRNQRLYDRAEELAPGLAGQFRADIARYEILSLFGGVWVDCDFECLRPIDDLLPHVHAFAAWEEQSRWVGNSILGAIPGHPFFERAIAGLADSVRRHRGSRPAVMTGPQYLTRLYRDAPDGLEIFDQRHFYPYSYRQLDQGRNEFPEAYAVHHWGNQRRLRGVPL